MQWVQSYSENGQSIAIRALKMPDDAETEEEREIHDADMQLVAFIMLIVALFIGYAYHN